MSAAADQRLSQIDQGFFNEPVDFRSEVIYFIIVDRFCDGHSNDGSQAEGSEQEDSKGLYDRSHQDWGKYWGGNLQGVINKIPVSYTHLTLPTICSV